MCTFSLKFNLRASNLQTFPGGMPLYPLIGKVAMLCASIICLHPELLTLTYFCGPPTIYHLPMTLTNICYSCT